MSFLAKEMRDTITKIEDYNKMCEEFKSKRTLENIVKLTNYVQAANNLLDDLVRDFEVMGNDVQTIDNSIPRVHLKESKDLLLIRSRRCVASSRSCGHQNSQ